VEQGREVLRTSSFAKLFEERAQHLRDSEGLGMARAGYLDGSAWVSSNALERVIDRLYNIPPALQRKLSTIKDLDARLERLKAALSERASAIEHMPSITSGSSSPEHLSAVLAGCEKVEEGHDVRLIAFFSFFLSFHLSMLSSHASLACAAGDAPCV
jgi:hypothetical protein